MADQDPKNEELSVDELEDVAGGTTNNCPNLGGGCSSSSDLPSDSAT